MYTFFDYPAWPICTVCQTSFWAKKKICYLLEKVFKKVQKRSKDQEQEHHVLDYPEQAVLSSEPSRPKKAIHPFSLTCHHIRWMFSQLHLAESRGTSEKTHFVSFPTVLEPHHGVWCAAFASSKPYIFALEHPLTVRLQKSFLPRRRLCLIAKMMQRVCGIKSALLERRPTLPLWTNWHGAQLSHLWRSFLWQSSLSFMALRSSNRTLQAAQSVVTDMAFCNGSAVMRRRLSGWSGATKASSAVAQTVYMHGCCRWSLTRTFNWDCHPCGTTLKPDWDWFIKQAACPQQQQVAIFLLLLHSVSDVLFRSVLIPLWVRLTKNHNIWSHWSELLRIWISSHIIHFRTKILTYRLGL